MARVIVVGQQILTEKFIDQRINQQLYYISGLQSRRDRISIDDYDDYWESAWNRLRYFKELKDKTKFI